MSFLIYGAIAGLLAFVLIILPRCYLIVEEGTVAVLTSFGRARRSAGKLVTYPPGLHAKLPWAQIHIVPLVEQSVELAGDSATAAMVKDGTILRFDSHLRTRLERDDLERWLFGVERPAAHVTSLFASLLRNEIATFQGSDAASSNGGSYAVLRRERRRLNERLEKFCADVIGNRYGVRFAGVDLVDVRPPDELASALNAVMQAQSEADTSFAHAEADASRRIMAAEHGVAVAKKRAEAVETEIVTSAEFLADHERKGTLDAYVARRRTEVLAQSRSVVLADG